jgi:uncharacterized membrane protein
MKKKLSIYGMVTLYLLAGLNHFINPEFYYKIIPPYLGNPGVINTVAGISEILLATLLLPVLTRKWACYGIILMLLAFVPAHIYMLQKEFPVNGRNTPAWILWVRLVIIQPLLILWAWSNRV